MEFRNFEGRFDSLKDDFTFMRADFNFKLDSSALNILSERNDNNSNPYLKTTIGSLEKVGGGLSETGNTRRAGSSNIY